MTSSSYLPVFETTRGDTVESIHYGAIAVVNSAGKLVSSFGDPETTTFTRSSAKPFQALPFIEAGGGEHFGLSQEEIALICASHSGTDAHVAIAESVQRKVGIDKTQLLCGLHQPYDKAAKKALLVRGESPSVNHHDCSGKHSGMLAYAKMHSWPTESYLERDHPIQKAILKAVSEMSDLPEAQIKIGTDGCSAPNFAMPLYNAALAYARLADPSYLTSERAKACRTIFDSMTSYPEMVSGPKRFDTLLMQAMEGNILAKGGAEGYQGLAIKAGAISATSPALGIAIKISDGDRGKRASKAIALETLSQLNAISNDQLESLSRFGPTIPIYNWRNIKVGQGRPVFSLS